MNFLPFILSIALLHTVAADSLSWSSLRGTLQKPQFNNQVATYRANSTGGVAMTFNLTPLASTANKFSYSKWEIDRWGDPAGIITPAGSWQAVSSAANDVGLTLWGYWGNGGTSLANGDSTSYQLTIDFDRPVNSLVLPLRGIDALLNTQGNNAIDNVTVASFLENSIQVSPNYSNIGTGIVRTGDTLKGDFVNPIGSDTGRSNTSNQGNATLAFSGTIDRVVLTITSEARHSSPALLQDGVQNWSVSLGDLTFDVAPLPARSQINWASRRTQLSKGFNNAPATYQTTSQDGKASATFDLDHISTTANKFSYSQWEIDRWGDPTEQQAPLGSWQVQSNAANEVALSLWGFWGTDGGVGSPPVVQGDATRYKLRIKFDQPVTDLRFPLHGIDAILSGGFNSFDRVTIDSLLNTVSQAAPNVTNLSPALAQSGNEITANINDPPSSTPNVTDNGSVTVRFPGAVDEVVITLATEARHPIPGLFQNGMQNWSISVGDLSFLPGIQNDISWAARQGQLVKPGFTNASASYQAASADGGVVATFQLDHLGTTGNKPSYSKWEINRWGDPTGVDAQVGAWQIMSNSLNDVVFGVWGYWGKDGTPNEPPVAVGDQTSYRLSVRFNRPVENLSFFLNGINALLKPEAGFNSQDILTVSSFLGTAPRNSPGYSQEGNAFTRSGDIFTGNFANQINNGFSGQHISDQGSVRVQLSRAVDRVDLVLVNRADHPVPANYQNGLQTFSFAVSGLSFRYGSVGPSAVLAPTSGPLPPALISTAPVPTAGPMALASTLDGRLILRVWDPQTGQPDLSRIQFSANLNNWGPWAVAQSATRSVDRGVEIELPAGTRPNVGFFRWRD